MGDSAADPSRGAAKGSRVPSQRERTPSGRWRRNGAGSRVASVARTKRRPRPGSEYTGTSGSEVKATSSGERSRSSPSIGRVALPTNGGREAGSTCCGWTKLPLPPLRPTPRPLPPHPLAEGGGGGGGGGAAAGFVLRRMPRGSRLYAGASARSGSVCAVRGKETALAPGTVMCEEVCGEPLGVVAALVIF
eukprot:scaffold7714_cov25-Tisochrysis_lutea.AAC.5